MSMSSVFSPQLAQVAYETTKDGNTATSAIGKRVEVNNGLSQKTGEQINESPSVYTHLKFKQYGFDFKTSDEQYQMQLTQDAKYNLAPHEATQDAMTTVTNELGKVQKVIALLQPGLSYKSWDFTLRDGQLEATGDKLTQKEKQWLTNVLNLDEKLVDATKKYYGAVVTYFENTADHTDPVSTYSSHSSTRRFAYNVAEQINGKLPIKQMLIDLQSRSSTPVSNYKKTLDDARHYLSFSTENKFYEDGLRARIASAHRYANGGEVEVSLDEYFASGDYKRMIKG